jgi:hypothetical protein
MIIPTQQASEFIKDYTRILVQIYKPFEDKSETKLLDKLATARSIFCSNRSLLDPALQALDAQSITILPEVISAVRSLEVKQWVYLKDTRSYSVFIDPSAKIAYGVLGLTERLRDIIGGSGAFVETGLLRYRSRYISDGIVSQVVWFGNNLKKEFTNDLNDIKTHGSFHDTFAA